MADSMIAAYKVYDNGKAVSDVGEETGGEEDAVKKWVEFLKPQDLTPQHLLEWRNAKPENLSEVAVGYQQRFLSRLTEWEEKMSKWRSDYQKAIAEQKKSLPE